MKMQVWIGAVSVAVALAGQSSPVAGARVLTLEPLNVGQGPIMESELQGSLCKGGCTPVPYRAVIGPNSVTNGVALLDDAIKTPSPDGATVVFGYSLGAEVAQVWLAEHGSDAGNPSQGDLEFVLIGNPYRKYGGAFTQAARLFNVLPADPDTDVAYHVTDIARQYDGFADFPDKVGSPGYLLAVANAAVGTTVIHSFYQDVDPDDPNNVTWQDGNTTYVLVPTESLPLVTPLRNLGLTNMADSLDEKLRPIIESAYSRPSTNAPVETSLASTESVDVKQVSSNAENTTRLPATRSDSPRLVGGVVSEPAGTANQVRKSVVSSLKENLARLAPKAKISDSAPTATRFAPKSDTSDTSGRSTIARTVDKIRQAVKAGPSRSTSSQTERRKVAGDKAAGDKVAGDKAAGNKASDKDNGTKGTSSSDA